MQNFSLDTVPFTEALELLYLRPEELLQGIYNDLIDQGLPDWVARQAAKKAFDITRSEVTKTLGHVIANAVPVDEWGV